MKNTEHKILDKLFQLYVKMRKVALFRRAGDELPQQLRAEACNTHNSPPNTAALIENYNTTSTHNSISGTMFHLTNEQFRK